MPKNLDKYWQKRKDYKCYHKILQFAKIYVPKGKSILDVGNNNCPYISWFDWFKNKYVLDLNYTKQIDDVIYIKCDFMEFKCKTPFDLVLCLQVLEHLHNPEAFCQKLFTISQIIIISVPYKWARGKCASHIQDPVDEHKLQSWTNANWKDMSIITEKYGIKRLIAVYDAVRSTQR